MSQKIVAQTEEDIRRLSRLLREISGPVEPHPSGKGAARILDLACGECHEAEALRDFLAESRGLETGEISLLGLDVRAREIANAARRCREAGDFSFRVGDATKLDTHREMGDDFDLVFLRHQNYWNGEKDWDEIFSHALGKLSNEGELIITSYFDREHELALAAIQRLGGELIRTQANEKTRNLGTPGKSVDRHIARFRRRA
jgi:SAM-dependent methyltransferase